MALLDEKTMEDSTLTAETVEEVETADTQENIEEEIVVEESGKQTKGKQQESNKKPSKIKAVFSELKKVSWPSFGSVVKKTVVVLSVTAVFLVVVFGIDFLLKFLYDLLTSNI